MHVQVQIDPEELDRLVAEHYVSVQRHPTAELWIYNYTARCQYQRYWTDVTLACRGLILDAQRQVVARPFAKFFNLQELEGSLPTEPFEVFEKMDGSLGIVYFVEGVPGIATRGSFASDQARRAQRMLDTRYRNLPWDSALTYLCEILYPENRIVVDYGGREDLVLLAVIETATGRELPLDDFADFGLPLVRRLDGCEDPRALCAQPLDNTEGYVIRFQESGLRVKVKFAEYVRLHHLVTGVHERLIWELLRDGRDLNELLDRVPDEFYQWVKQSAERLQSEFARIEAEARTAFVDTGDRKRNAERYLQTAHAQLLFAMLDGKPYAHHIWKQLRPDATRPFREDL
jgi:RNA ligase